jgi:hypothetical protein
MLDLMSTRCPAKIKNRKIVTNEQFVYKSLLIERSDWIYRSKDMNTRMQCVVGDKRTVQEQMVVDDRFIFMFVIERSEKDNE